MTTQSVGRVRLMALAFSLLATLQSDRAHGATDEVVKAYEQAYAKFSSVLLEVTQVVVPKVSAREMFELTGQYDFSPTSWIIVMTRDGKTYVEKKTKTPLFSDVMDAIQAKSADEIGDPTYDDVRSVLPRVKPTTEHLFFMFDGKRLYKKSPYELAQLGVARTTYSVVDIERLKSAYFPPIPWNYSLYSFPSPGVPKDDEFRQKHRFPDLLTKANYVYNNQSEKIDGLPCVTLHAEGHDRMWLAPSLGYAVKKRELYYERNLVVVIAFSNFRQWVPGVWLPSTLVVTNYGCPGFAPDQFVGRPLYENRYQVIKATFDQPAHEEYFRFPAGAGDLVIDGTLADERERRLAMESTGGVLPSVSYLVPADERELDAVVAQAVEESRRMRISPFLVALVVTNLLLVIAGFVYWKRRS